MARTTAPPLLLSCTLLASCGTACPRPEPIEVAVQVMPEADARLLSCLPSPSQPSDPSDPEQAATYVLDLGEAHHDCSRTLGEFVAWYLDARERLRRLDSEASVKPGG